MNVGFPVFVVIVVLAFLFFLRQRDPMKRALILKRAGFGVMAFSTAFFGLFVAGDTFTDPGGWEALGLVAAWAVPLAAIAAIAWYRPRWAIRVFAVLCLLSSVLRSWRSLRLGERMDLVAAAGRAGVSVASVVRHQLSVSG